jgi:Fe(3+) dicitrate transport protein
MPKFRIPVLRFGCRKNRHFSIVVPPFLPTRNHEEPNNKTRYAHTSPEVNGATIAVTKKTSVVDLDAQPVVIDNNQRELFDRLPSIVLAEQQNPTELNLSYRGLGNPQESE